MEGILALSKEWLREKQEFSKAHSVQDQHVPNWFYKKSCAWALSRLKGSKYCPHRKVVTSGVIKAKYLKFRTNDWWISSWSKEEEKHSS